MKKKKQVDLIAILRKAAAALDNAALKEAADLYVQVEEIEPGNIGANLGLGMILNLCSKPEQALQLLAPVWNRIQAATPEQRATLQPITQAEVLAQIGLALQMLDRNDEALLAYREAQKIFHSSMLEVRIRSLETRHVNAQPVAAHVKKAGEYLEQQQLLLARQSYETALKLNPDNDVALHGMGTISYLTGDLDKALALTQHAIIMQPTMAEYQSTLGNIFLAKGELEKARIFLRRAVDLDPRLARSFNNLGIVLKRLGRIGEAEAAYRKALELNPAYAPVWNNLGNLLRMTGETKEAATCLRKALELSPDYADARENLALLLAESGDHKKPGSVEKNKAAVKKKPGAKTKPAVKAKPPAKKKPAAKTKPAAKKTPAAKTKPAAKKTPAAKTKPAAKKKPAVTTKPAAKKTPAAKKRSAAKTRIKAKAKPNRR